MDKLTTLPLFAWEPPCKLIAFPLTARIGKVRRCAEVLETKQGNDATGYWRHQVRLMVDQLEKAGTSPDEINRQIAEFQQAVQNELVRRSYEGQSADNNNPKGAA